MFKKFLMAAGLAALAAIADHSCSRCAEAESRWRFLHPDYYFCNPPPRDFYAEDYGDEEYYEDEERPLAYYDPDDDDYEPRYYQPRYEGEEPVYIAPKKKKKTVKAVPGQARGKEIRASSQKKAWLALCGFGRKEGCDVD